MSPAARRARRNAGFSWHMCFRPATYGCSGRDLEAQGLPSSLGSGWTSKLSFSRTHPHTLVRYRCPRTSHCHPSPACGLPTPPARTSGTVDIYPSIGRRCAYALTLPGIGSLDSGLQWLHDSPKSDISRLSGVQLEVWERRQCKLHQPWLLLVDYRSERIAPRATTTILTNGTTSATSTS